MDGNLKTKSLDISLKKSKNRRLSEYLGSLGDEKINISFELYLFNIFPTNLFHMIYLSRQLWEVDVFIILILWLKKKTEFRKKKN